MSYSSDYDKNEKPFLKQTIKNKTPKIFFNILKIVFCFCFGFLITFGYTVMKDVSIPKTINKTTDQIVFTNTENKPSATNISVSEPESILTSIIKETKPSIVTITTLNEQANNFFNLNLNYEDAGSGIIFHETSTKLYILTNNHVIENAVKVGVAVDDNEAVLANFVGKDESNDLAVISVEKSALKDIGATDFSVAKFGDSSLITEGSSVIAIGNALGEGNTATLGIISSTNASVKINGKDVSMLQTTAAINPGNSGGALINSKGEVIGVNTAKVVSKSIEGIGYSIPSNTFIPIVEKIMNNTNPASLGVYVRDLNSEFNFENLGGALVVEVIEGGAAHLSGIRAGDIITSINKAPIFNSQQLIDEIKNYSAGKTIELTVLRNNSLKKIKVKLQAAKNNKF